MKPRESEKILGFVKIMQGAATGEFIVRGVLIENEQILGVNLCCGRMTMFAVRNVAVNFHKFTFNFAMLF